MPEVTTETSVPNGLEMTPMSFFSQVWTGSWKDLPEDDLGIDRRAEFAENFRAFYQGASTLREKFDAIVWAGHVDGSIPESIKPLRAPRTGETGGRKAAPKTAAELLLKK